MTTLIELDSIAKRYRTGPIEVLALRDLTLTIDRGELIAIIGPSGSGKTTLLDILGCLSNPTTGRYRLDGADVSALDEEALAAIRNRMIGFVFQTFQLLPRHTALQNVALPLLYAGVGRQERERRAAEALEGVGLADRMAHHPNQLSGGQQQRVAIARALVTGPSLILADEPTGNLDSTSGREIMQLLTSLHRRGTTVILVTHNQEIADQAPRVIALRDGRIVEDRTAATVNAGARIMGQGSWEQNR
ncbi:MAG: ABC transporter ATP-binding protein [Nitrospirae bacterium]|nr:ABC transporter ATP-binding protein [Nitrospirota bacterium]